jgi:hypothetical protein
MYIGKKVNLYEDAPIIITERYTLCKYRTTVYAYDVSISNLEVSTAGKVVDIRNRCSHTVREKKSSFNQNMYFFDFTSSLLFQGRPIGNVKQRLKKSHKTSFFYMHSPNYGF